MRSSGHILILAALVAPALSCGNGDPGGSIDLDCYDLCLPDTPPDEECYRSKRDPGSETVGLAEEIAFRYMDYHPPREMDWNWEEGVLMFAMTELYRVTGESTLLDYGKAWMDHHIEQGYEIKWSDSCPPALTALALYKETSDPVYREVVERVLSYLYNEALRTEEGGISHMGTVDLFGPTLWLDSLFMFGMVLTRWGEHESDETALAEMGSQLRIFKDLLQVPSGLMVHAYDWPVAQDPEVYWARGNGWVTAAAHDYLRVKRMLGQRDKIAEDLLDGQVAGIVQTQDPDTGLWWTILNHPQEIYLETSATALFAYGIARGYRYGFRDESVLPVLARAVEGILSRITYDNDGRPVVTGISGPTTVGRFESYARVDLEDDLSYGVGASILALVEVSGLPIPPS